jgi:hypothetical protein
LNEGLYDTIVYIDDLMRYYKFSNKPIRVKYELIDEIGEQQSLEILI